MVVYITTQCVVYKHFHHSVRPISTNIYSFSRIIASNYGGHSILLWRHGLAFRLPSQNKRREYPKPLRNHVIFNQTIKHSFVLLKHAIMIYGFYFIWFTIYKIHTSARIICTSKLSAVCMHVQKARGCSTVNMSLFHFTLILNSIAKYKRHFCGL